MAGEKGFLILQTFKALERRSSSFDGRQLSGGFGFRDFLL